MTFTLDHIWPQKLIFVKNCTRVVNMVKFPRAIFKISCWQTFRLRSPTYRQPEYRKPSAGKRRRRRNKNYPGAPSLQPTIWYSWLCHCEIADVWKRTYVRPMNFVRKCDASKIIIWPTQHRRAMLVTWLLKQDCDVVADSSVYNWTEQHSGTP